MVFFSFLFFSFLILSSFRDCHLPLPILHTHTHFGTCTHTHMYTQTCPHAHHFLLPCLSWPCSRTAWVPQKGLIFPGAAAAAGPSIGQCNLPLGAELRPLSTGKGWIGLDRVGGMGTWSTQPPCRPGSAALDPWAAKRAPPHPFALCISLDLTPSGESHTKSGVPRWLLAETAIRLEPVGGDWGGNPVPSRLPGMVAGNIPKVLGNDPFHASRARASVC